MSFEEKLNRLEEINNNMKEGDVPIEKAMKLFEEGIKLDGHIFSGSTVVDYNNTAGFGAGAVVAFYTSWTTSREYIQTQCIAYRPLVAYSIICSLFVST